MLKTHQAIASWLDMNLVQGYVINDDLTVDVLSGTNVYLANKQLKKLPVQFRHVTSSFDCSQNLLTSLKGVPQKVEGNFNCSFNKLTSFQDGPEYVEKSYVATSNFIKQINDDLAYHIGENLDLSHNPIQSIENLTFVPECKKFIHKISLPIFVIKELSHFYKHTHAGLILHVTPNELSPIIESLHLEKNLILTPLKHKKVKL